jgi:hypothetical protein
MVTPDRAGDAYRFDALRARYKRSPRDQQHGGTIDRSRAATEERGVTTELVLRVIDHDIAVGVWQDVSEHGWKCRGPERRTARSEERPAPWTRGVHGDVTKLPVDELPAKGTSSTRSLECLSTPLPSTCPALPRGFLASELTAHRLPVGTRWRRPCPTRRPLLALADLPETSDRFRRAAGSK